MKIYFFGTDEYGFHYAGIKTNGVRSTRMIVKQGLNHYCTTGSKIAHNWERHDFTAAQEAAFQCFILGGQSEFWEGIA